uniref:Uncharacterized protein n=1 Tax=Eutreptiella gymnastica TaxID=73025 RepID=A0A7S1NPA1_9EUGL
MEQDSPLAQQQPLNSNFVMGLGTGSAVPKYLRWHGKLNRRYIRKADLEQIIKDFWKYKQAADAKSGKRSGVQDTMYHFLKMRYGVQGAIAEHGYGIRDACLQHLHDADAEVFYLILEGQLDEQVWHDQAEILDTLREQLISLASKGRKKPAAALKRKVIIENLPKWFPTKTESDMMYLKLTLSQDFPGNDVNIAELFSEDAEGNQKQFIEALRDQFIFETKSYITEIQEAMYKASEDGRIQCNKATAVFNTIDPTKPAEEVDRIVQIGFDPTLSTHVSPLSVLELDVFLTNMKSTTLKRSGERPADSEAEDSGAPAEPASTASPGGEAPPA